MAVRLNQQSNSKNSIFCRYCKETGHLLEECQLRIAITGERPPTRETPAPRRWVCNGSPNGSHTRRSLKRGNRQKTGNTTRNSDP